MMPLPASGYLFLLVYPVFASPAVARPTVLLADLDRDGRRERIVLNASQQRTLSLWRGGKRLWRGVPRRWRPWKITLADVDGDRRLEIILGVHKATRYFPKPHNCLFVYRFDGSAALPKWLGSHLSKPFTDFAFANLDRDRADELIALERRRDGTQRIAVYSWNGFGFTLDWERGAWKEAHLLAVNHQKITVEAGGRQTILSVSRRFAR